MGCKGYKYHNFKSIWDLWVGLWRLYLTDKLFGAIFGAFCFISLCFSTYLVSWFHCAAERVNTDRWCLTPLCRLGPTLAASCRPSTWMATPTRISSWSERRCTWAQKEMSRDKSTCTNSTRYDWKCYILSRKFTPRSRWCSRWLQTLLVPH